MSSLLESASSPHALIEELQSQVAACDEVVAVLTRELKRTSIETMRMGVGASFVGYQPNPASLAKTANTLMA